MAKIKPTPGPWHLEETDNDGTAFIPLMSDLPNGGVREIAHIRGDGGEELEITAEDEANARLLAAAPELLEAILYYFDVLDEVRGKQWREKPDHVTKKMLEAIRKATGQHDV